MSASSTRAPRSDSARNRTRVLDAAGRVFAERGYDATVSEIAREAGVGVATVYRKFDDKDAVLDALFDDKIEALVALAIEAEKNDDAGVAARQLMLGVMSLRAHDRGLEAVLTGPERSARFARELGARFLPIADRIVARAVAAGELRAGFSADEICLLGFMVGKIADVTRTSDPDVWRRYAQLLIDGSRVHPSAFPLAPAALTFGEAAAALGRAG